MRIGSQHWVLVRTATARAVGMSACKALAAAAAVSWVVSDLGFATVVDTRALMAILPAVAALIAALSTVALRSERVVASTAQAALSAILHLRRSREVSADAFAAIFGARARVTGILAQR